MGDVIGTTAGNAAGIVGLGFYVPKRVLTNFDLEKMVDTSDEWIRSRTGISERHIVADDETTADLAEKAARRALEDAGLTPDDIQLIIVATATPDYFFPSTAALLQDKLKCSCAAFDLEAACSGFVYALVTAQQFVASGAAQHVLVVGAEVMSRVTDWTDRNTCVLFGDGAGAAVVSRVPDGHGVLAFDLGSDGSGGNLLAAPTSASHLFLGTTFTAGKSGIAQPGGPVSKSYIAMDGKEVYRFAVNVMGMSALRALERGGIPPEKIDLFVPHQANVRIIDAAARRLGVGPEKVFVNVGKYGNTSAASIPIALCEARDEGRIKAGDYVVIVGFGAGLTWGSCAMRWV